MSDRKAVNKYYPPEWTPDQGGLNKFRGQHHLRERARKLDQGIMIVRFELPFHIYCNHCDKHIGRGVRYNAEKKAVGAYYSTRIYEFRCKCHLCGNWFVIRTDPKNADYEVVEGARRAKLQKMADAERGDAGTELGAVYERPDALKSDDPFAQLEHRAEDQRVGERERTRLQRLKDQQAVHYDQLAVTSVLRARFRTRKKKDIVELERGQAKGLAVPLLDQTPQDRTAASQFTFEKDSDQFLARKRRAELSAVAHSAVLPTGGAASSSAKGSSALSDLAKRRKLLMAPGLFKTASASNIMSRLSAPATTTTKNKPPPLLSIAGIPPQKKK